MPTPQIEAPREARAGDNAQWGGFQGITMQSLLSGRSIQSIKGARERCLSDQQSC